MSIVLQDSIETDTAFQAIADSVQASVGYPEEWIVVATILSALATVMIAIFTSVTWYQGRKDREERTSATDARIALNADGIRRAIGEINKRPPNEYRSRARQYGRYVHPVRQLVIESPNASRHVSEYVREAYLHLKLAVDQYTRAAAIKDNNMRLAIAEEAANNATMCYQRLSDAVPEKYKRSWEVVVGYPPSIGTGPAPDEAGSDSDD